jgi:hypothetical protein
MPNLSQVAISQPGRDLTIITSAMTDPTKEAGRNLLNRYASRLKFPQLFTVTAVLFVVDLIVPDLFPFVDEILLGLATLLLANWKRKIDPVSDSASKPPTKDITPDQ